MLWLVVSHPIKWIRCGYKMIYSHVDTVKSDYWVKFDWTQGSKDGFLLSVILGSKHVFHT